MNRLSNLLMVRALNYWRRVHMPTYIGLRLFAEQVPKSEDSGFLLDYLLRKVPLRKANRSRVFKTYKGVSSNKEPQFRDMCAISPSNALAEAYALYILSNVSTLKKNKSYVYSYRWPASGAGNVYSYFYSGYRQRNNMVTRLLRENSGYFVAVNDIESFYPSIDGRRVVKALGSYLNTKQRNVDFVQQICTQLVETSQRGLPIGPALSPILSNMSLVDVDREMHNALEDRYLRYVDDIYLVAEKDEVLRMRVRLGQVLDEQGLKMNQAKQELITSAEWLSHWTDWGESDLIERFHRLLYKIVLLLWWKPQLRQEMHLAFRNQGIAMPIDRLASYSNYGRFQRFIKGLAYHKDIYLLHTLRDFTIGEAIKETTYLRGKLAESLSRANTPLPADSRVINKFRSQRILFLVNRLLRLTPYQDYSKLRDSVPDSPELYEFGLLIDSLIKGNVSRLVAVPGMAVSLFADIRRELDLQLVLVDPPSDVSTPDLLDSICTLLVYGVAKVSLTWVDKLDANDRELLRFCYFDTLESRNLSDLSYEDELRTLQIGSNPEKLQTIISSRFNDMEQINLESLVADSYVS